MRKLSGLITKATIGALSFAAMASNVFATGYSYNYSTTSSDDAAAAGIATLFTGGFAIVWICAFLIGCVFLVFNIWMLVDVIKRTEAEVPNKSMWTILLIIGLFLGFGGIAALVYYFTVKKKLK